MLKLKILKKQKEPRKKALIEVLPLKNPVV